MLSYKLNFISCDNLVGFCKPSHIAQENVWYVFVQLIKSGGSVAYAS